jgi:hypothetical protein
MRDRDEELPPGVMILGLAMATCLLALIAHLL